MSKDIEKEGKKQQLEIEALTTYIKDMHPYKSKGVRFGICDKVNSFSFFKCF